MTDQETLAPKPPEGTPTDQLKSQEQEQIKDKTQGELDQLKGAEMESVIGKIASLLTNEEFKKAFKEEKFGEAMMIAVKIFFGSMLDNSGKKQQEIEQALGASLPEFESLLTKMKSDQEIPEKISISTTDIGLLKGKGIESADDLSDFLKKFTENDRQNLEKNPEFNKELEKGVSIYRYITLLERARDEKSPSQNSSEENTPTLEQASSTQEGQTSQTPDQANAPEAQTSLDAGQKLLLDTPKSPVDIEAGQCCNFEIKGYPPVTIKHDRIEIAGKAFHVESKVKKFGFELFLQVAIKKITPNGDNFDVTMGALGQSETKTLTPEYIKKLIVSFDSNKEKQQFDYQVQTGGEERHFKFIAA